MYEFVKKNNKNENKLDRKALTMNGLKKETRNKYKECKQNYLRKLAK